MSQRVSTTRKLRVRFRSGATNEGPQVLRPFGDSALQNPSAWAWFPSLVATYKGRTSAEEAGLALLALTTA